MPTSRTLVHALERLAVASVALTAEALAATPRGHDLTLAQWRALVLLTDEQPRRIGDLAERLGTSLPSASRLVRRLETAGMVATERDESDRRATLVSLTRSGRAAHRAVVTARGSRLQHALEHADLSADAPLHEAITVLARTLDGAADDA